MMDISSNELFHFTKFQNLRLILLTQSLLPRYNLEFTVLSHDWTRKAALLPVPMVCFCDIPFELSKNHRNRYGNSGIVFTEEWKIKTGLNPMIYIQKDSLLGNILADLKNCPDSFLSLINDYPKDYRISQTLNRIAKDLKHISYFLKQFENKEEINIQYENKIRTFEKRKFYDEREWRYIPFKAELNEELFISIWDYDDKSKLKNANLRMEKYKLTFELSDIKYLIVEKESEKKELTDFLCKTNNDENLEIKVLKRN